MNRFQSLPIVNIQRSSFDRSFNLKTSFDVDFLVPILVDEVLPGDTFNLQMATFGRMSTPITALMDNLYMDFFFFFVPNRLVWTNFPRFMGEEATPGASTSFIMPISTSPGASGAGTGYPTNSLQDYLGLPARISAVPHQTLPIRGYSLIWNEWFRDPNMVVPGVVDLGDGPDNGSLYFLRKRMKQHDYFTSCLAAPQKGLAAQLAPLVTLNSVNAPGLMINRTGAIINAAQETIQRRDLTGGNAIIGLTTGTEMKYDPAGTMVAITTIEQIRLASRLQDFYEKNARGGNRYIEQNLAHFGVVSDDLRSMRSQYLGGGSTLINIHPVAQTSVTAATPQGNLAAFATQNSQGIGFTKSFTEHGYIIGLVCVRGELHYQQGLHKMWSRSTRVDHYIPALAHLGEQAVLNKELTCFGQSSDNDAFGYQERWSEYKSAQNRITGQMRSNAASTFDINHLAQNYGGVSTLNETFVTSVTPIARISAVPSEPDILLDVHFRLICARPMPMYSLPATKGVL